MLDVVVFRVRGVELVAMVPRIILFTKSKNVYSNVEIKCLWNRLTNIFLLHNKKIEKDSCGIFTTFYRTATLPYKKIENARGIYTLFCVAEKIEINLF